jgi:PKD repeat protein
VVAFTDTSTGTVTSHNWTFGDTYTSTLANPTHIYHPAGNYTVNMNVTFDDGSFGENTSYVELKTDDDIWLKSWLQFENATVVGLKGLPWTAADGAAVSTLQKKFGAQSLAITSNDARIYTSPSANWDWGLANAEMEFWIRPVTIVADKNLISRTTGANAGTGTATGWGLRSNASGTGYYWWMGTTATKTPDFALTAGAWTHIKIERDGSDVEIYKNGVILSDTSMPGNFDTANSIVIGYKAGGAENTFYVDEFRFTNGISREVGAFDAPYAAYRGNLYTNWENINVNATLRYKTDPAFPSNAIIYNQTGARHRTVQIQNLTNATYISGKLNYEPGSMFAQTVVLNNTVYADMTLESFSIDNNNGIVNFNVSRAGGISALFNNRTDLIDVPMLYWKYSTDTDVYSYFAQGNLIDGEHNAAYPIFNFIGTNVTLGMWGTPGINFVADDTTPAMLQTVTFTDTTTNYPDSYEWDFGDGGTSTLKNPTYAYTAMGTYNVSLHAYLAANTSITNTSTKVNYITVGAIPPLAPVADFTGVPINVALGSAVQYNDTSTNTPTSWLWAFGDGSGSTNQNPSHVFAAVGNYTVNLTVTNPTGSNTTSKYNYTQVSIAGGSGFTQQDLIMSPQYTLTATFVDSVTLLPIPVVSVIDSAGHNATTSTGVFVDSYPYSVVVLYASSTGYTSRSASYVVDADRAVTIPMTKAVESPVNIAEPPKPVQFHVQSFWGAPISGATISVLGITTTTGSWDWVVQLLGIPLDSVAINGTAMTDTTDSLGNLEFLMIPSAKYSVNVTASGYTFPTTIIAPHDSQYTIVANVNGTGWFESGNNTLTQVNVTVSTANINSTHGFINISYNDAGLTTTGGTITVYADNSTPGGLPNVVQVFPVTSNVLSSSAIVTIPQGGAGYKVQVSATNTITPLTPYERSFAAYFKGAPVQLAGFDSKILLWFALFCIIFTAMFAGAAHAPQVSIIICIEAWAFWIIGWLDPLTDLFGYGDLSVMGWLSFATFLAILWNWREGKRKEKGT